MEDLNLWDKIDRSMKQFWEKMARLDKLNEDLQNRIAKLEDAVFSLIVPG